MSFASTVNQINTQIAATTQAAVAATQLVEAVAPPEATSGEKLVIATQAFASIFAASTNSNVAAGAALTSGIINAAVLVQNLFGLFRKKSPVTPAQ